MIPIYPKTAQQFILWCRLFQESFKLRTSKAAHPQMQKLACRIQKLFAKKWPCVFGGN